MDEKDDIMLYNDIVNYINCDSVLYDGEYWNYHALKLDRPSFYESKSSGLESIIIPSLVPSSKPSDDASGVHIYFPSLEPSLLGLLFSQRPLRKRLLWPLSYG